MSKPNLGNVMVDLETLGNLAGCVIVVIAAVEFDLYTGETGRTFYQNVDVQSCIDNGLRVDGSTIKWWLEQSDEARAEIIKEGIPLGEALYKFRIYIQDIGACEMWAKGFDLPVLKAAYKAVKKEVPWVFRTEQEVRTLFRNNPEVAKNIKFIGTPHNAIDDCLHQIRQCVAVQKTIKIINE